jgi:hypothetical protein
MGSAMSRGPNYRFERQQREQRKNLKKEEKRKEREERRAVDKPASTEPGGESAPAPEAAKE